MKKIKISDSSPNVTEGSRADEYWNRYGWKNLFEKLRKGSKIPASISNDTNDIAKKFNLKGIGFGNWLNIEDRINYSYSLIYALYDLNKVLRFNYNIGLGVLTITFGARGRGSALAHYEPCWQYINITRYANGKSLKEIRFFTTGGIGAFAHEYGHFLDYFAGEYLAKNNKYFSLTNGDSISKKKTDTKQTLRVIMNNIMEKIFWKKPNVEPSNYYKRLTSIIKNTEKGEYWIRRNEIFARAFEVYVAEKLIQNNIQNELLTKRKYINTVYLKPSEIIPIMPLFDSLLTEIRKQIK